MEETYLYRCIAMQNTKEARFDGARCYHTAIPYEAREDEWDGRRAVVLDGGVHDRCSSRFSFGHAKSKKGKTPEKLLIHANPGLPTTARELGRVAKYIFSGTWITTTTSYYYH
ncbi:hypothetical protein H6P81_013918 [Aristolochia fimbriata]|uniref:Uncharacterized protein n=1 Tax=Aristolochia fimbriata TaxID=158543 RepID=A0AAV7EI70_ARIFI|nr:hypothetical protein H6P81_013918 [Aristolochia fimbriata]